MPTDASQRAVFDFLKQRLLDQHSFTKEQLRGLTNWTVNAFRTYWSKQFQHFMVPAPGDQFRVAESFRPYITWEKFRQHVTQMRRHGMAAYERIEHELVRIFEFYMPLTHEHALKDTLDALFYSDIIKPKLRAIDADALNGQIPRRVGEPEDAHFNRICEFLDDKFGGYSVYHVDGRFRLEDLTTQMQAAHIQIDGRPYLMDETTAVARFILPCDSKEEAEMVWFFFEQLFVNSILQRVNGEAEIWMVETGMFQRVWVWRVPDDDEQNGEEEADDPETPSSGDLLS